MKNLIAFSIILFFQSTLLAQCPVDEADLANGGTFSGNCNVNVGGNITITGAVVWTSGTLNINGNNGDVNISGSLTINGGTVNTTDNSDGDIEVLNGSVVTIAAGAALNARDEISVRNGGAINVSGTMTSTTSDIDIDAGGTITVNSGGSINTGADDDLVVQGTLTMNDGSVANVGNDVEVTGTVTANGTMNVVDDFNVDGGTVSVGSTGILNITDDIGVDNGGTFTNNGSIDVGDNVVIEGGSSFTNTGTLVVADNFEILDGGTTVTNSGAITVGNDLVIDDAGATLINDNLITVYDDITNNGTLTGSGGINLCDPTGTEATNNFTNNGTYSMTGVMCMCNTNNNNVFTNNGVATVGTTIDVDCSSLNVVLPIDLLFFRASREEEGVLIHWSTANEVNNDYMEVERSLDGVDWEVVAHVQGSRTSNEVNEYFELDYSAPKEGSLYYRLRQIDINGDYELFPIVKVSAVDEGFSEQPQLKVFPNPISRGTHLKLNFQGIEDSDVSIQLFDLMGRKVFLKEVFVESDNQIEDLEILHSLEPGHYFIIAESKGYIFKSKLVIQ